MTEYPGRVRRRGSVALAREILAQLLLKAALAIGTDEFASWLARVSQERSDAAND